jgi:hypothetical protein
MKAAAGSIRDGLGRSGILAKSPFPAKTPSQNPGPRPVTSCPDCPIDFLYRFHSFRPSPASCRSLRPSLSVIRRTVREDCASRTDGADPAASQAARQKFMTQSRHLIKRRGARMSPEATIADANRSRARCYGTPVRTAERRHTTPGHRRAICRVCATHRPQTPCGGLDPPYDDAIAAARVIDGSVCRTAAQPDQNRPNEYAELATSKSISLSPTFNFSSVYVYSSASSGSSCGRFGHS